MSGNAASFSLGAGPDACLLLHGLTGAPSEVLPVAQALARAGIHCLGPLLPGHGTRPEDLFGLTRDDLREAATSALRSLSGARRVYVVGLSMGALLATGLAARSRMREGIPSVERLVLCAPALEFRGLARVFTSVVGRLPGLPLLSWKPARGVPVPEVPADVAEGPLRADGSYVQVPLGWGRELRLLSAETLQLARRVHCPTLILHGRRDTTAAVSGAQKLAAALGSTSVELRVLPDSGHLLPLDVDGPQVCSDIVSFLKES